MSELLAELGVPFPPSTTASLADYREASAYEDPFESRDEFGAFLF